MQNEAFMQKILIQVMHAVRLVLHTLKRCFSRYGRFEKGVRVEAVGCGTAADSVCRGARL